MKKQIALVCAAVLLLCVSAGAFAGGQGETAAASEGPLELTILYDGITWTKANRDINESEELKMWEKLTNTDLTYITPPHSNYSEKVNLYFASGDLPDVVGSISPGFLSQLVDTGGVMDMTSLIEGPMGNVLVEKSRLDSDDFLPYYVAGKAYAIPALRAFNDAHQGFMFRKDWLDKLGLEKPQTLEGYREVLDGFTYDDPDGNGKDDTYGITGRTNFSYLPQGFMGAFGLWGSPGSIVYEVQDGTVVVQATQEKYKDFLRYMRTLVYEDKVTTPNALFNTSDQWKQEMFGSVAGMWFHSSTRIDEYFMTNMKKANPDWEERGIELDFLIPPLGPDGHGGPMNGFRAGGGNLFTTNVKDPERTFEYFVHAYTDPELIEFAKYGLEGPDHLVVNGKKVLNPEAKKDERLHQVRGLVFLESKWPIDDEILSFHWGERAVAAYKVNAKYNLPVNTDWLGKPVLEEESTYADLGSIKLEHTMKIVLGTVDLETGWMQLQQALKDGGVEKVRAAYQRWYDANKK